MAFVVCAVALVLHVVALPGSVLAHTVVLVGFTLALARQAEPTINARRIAIALLALLAAGWSYLTAHLFSEPQIELSAFALLLVLALLVAGKAYVSEAAQREAEVARLGSLGGDPDYWRRVALTSMGLYVTRIETAFLEAALAPLRPDRILDVGAGSGRLEPPLLRLGRRILAIDLTRSDLEIMERHPRLGRVWVGESASLPFADASMDAIVAIEVPAVAEVAWFRTECARLLKPGGLVILSTYNAASYKGLLRRSMRRRRQQQDWDGLYYRLSFGRQERAWLSAGFHLRASRGFYWLPFGRESDSRLIPLFATLEEWLPLLRTPRWSPWVMAAYQLEG